MSDEVDYDVESYAKQLEILLSKKIGALVSLRGESVVIMCFTVYTRILAALL